MALTRLDLKDRVRFSTDTAAGIFLTEANLNESVQDAYDETVLAGGLIDRCVDIEMESKLVYYDLPTLIPDFYAMVGLYNLNTKRWMIPVLMRVLDEMRDDWEVMRGQPEWFCPINFRYVAVSPTLTEAVGSFRVYYLATAPTLGGDSETLEVPDGYEEVLQRYAECDVLEQTQEYTKAANNFRKFVEGIKGGKIRTGSRILPDYVGRLREK